MNLKTIINQVFAGLTSIYLVFALPTSTLSTSTISPTSTNQISIVYLEPNPCGGIDSNIGPVTDEQVNESIQELLPITQNIHHTVSDFKERIGSKRVQNTQLQNISMMHAPSKYPDEIFPYFPTENYWEKEGLFGEIYTNNSMLEIYFSRIKEIEEENENDQDLVKYCSNIITKARGLRCHAQIIFTYFEETTPTFDFSVPEDKIYHVNAAFRCIKHYQISHMAQSYLGHLKDFLYNI